MTLRLNLACGGSRWPGFENSDIDGHADRHVDLEEFPYPYETGSASVVMMSHALFMGNPTPLHPDLGAIMGECHRILEPGGWLRIDDNPVRCYRDGEYVDRNEVAQEAMRGYPRALRITRKQLRRILLNAGFSLVVEVPQGETNIPCDPEIRDAILANRMGHVSFTVEAQK